MTGEEGLAQINKEREHQLTELGYTKVWTKIGEAMGTEIENFGINRLCIIRTYSAGVHFGEVIARAGTDVLLKNARRIHYWEGAFTLSAIALNGAGEGSRLSVAIPEILLTQIIEIIPCAEGGSKWLTEKAAHEAH